MSTATPTASIELSNTTITSVFTVTSLADNTSVLEEVNALNATTTQFPPLGENDDLLNETKEILFTIQYVMLPIFLVTGILGNGLTIVTMASRSFSQMTSRYILIFLAISDTILLLTQPFNKLWVVTLLGKDFRAISDVSCKVFFVIFRSAKMTSSWLVVLLCFERFVAVVFPLKVKRILRKRIIFPAIALDYIIMFGYNSVWSFSSQVVNGICKPDFPSNQHKVFVIIGTTFYSFIPTFLLVIFTPKIILTLRMQKSIRRALTSSRRSEDRKGNRANNEMTRASYMVLGVMIAYILLIIPITLVHLIAFSQGVSAFDITTYRFFVFREIAQMLEQVNYAVNFFFYTLCSSKFRRRVLDIVCCTAWRSRSQLDSNDSRSSQKNILPKAFTISNSRHGDHSQ